MKDSHDGPLLARFGPEMDSENSADHVFVDIDAEGQSDLLVYLLVIRDGYVSDNACDFGTEWPEVAANIDLVRPP